MSAPNSHRSPLISCSPRLPAESATYHCLVLEGTTLSDGDEEADEGEVDSLSGVGRTQPPRAAAVSLSGRQSHWAGEVTGGRGRGDADWQWRVTATTGVVRRLPVHCVRISSTNLALSQYKSPYQTTRYYEQLFLSGLSPSTRNPLSAHIRSIDTISIFKRHLKFHLFHCPCGKIKSHIISVAVEIVNMAATVYWVQSVPNKAISGT